MKNISYKIIFILFILYAGLLNAKNYPQVYSQLGTPLFKAGKTFLSLAKIKAFVNEKEKIDSFLYNSELLFKQGLLVDESSNKKEIKNYLKNLRKLQKQYDVIEKLYKQKLYKSIYDAKVDTFYSLVQTPLSFIKEDSRLKEKIVSFYKGHKLKNLAYLDDLSKDLALDEASYTYLDKMFQQHQKKQKVEVLQNLDSFTPRAKLEKPVRVVSIKNKGRFDVYLENNTYSDVTIKLQAKNIVNLNASVSFPYIKSYPARSRTKIMHFSIMKKNKSSSYQMLYSSILGRLNPAYKNNYLYALPYARGSAHTLTQGFNGEQTHKGRSAYALDFSMPIGTKVHAMRGGIVIAVVSKHTEHGFSSEFASKANHIIISHDDGTMAMYAHLNTDGVRVKLGDKVYKHQHIGYSGNTGYSSGPHLHVHISALQSFSKGSSSVRFLFKAKRGRIDSPVEKSIYSAI